MEFSDAEVPGRLKSFLSHLWQILAGNCLHIHWHTFYRKSLDMLVLTCLLTIYFSKLQFKLCNCQPPLTLLLLVEDPARRQTITSSHRPTNTSSQIPYWSQHSEAHTSQSNKHNVTEQQETKTHTVKHSSVQIISRSGTTTKTRKPQKLLESLVANPR